ncbi:redoxin domain-containing protein [Verrucomicrobiales bacterium]|nr:redoxin domain-containing protein [Verrucomicrobiales bacterium]MDA7926611.1 redoxin domain-containing protein [Verrucomicrobiales bacterium]
MKTSLFLVAALSIYAVASAAPPPPEGVKTIEPGATAPEFDLPGVDGRNHTLAEYSEADILAILFTCNHCPSAQGAESRVKQLVSDYADKSFQLVAISPNDPLSVRLNELGYSVYGDTLEDMRKHAIDNEFNFPFLYDGETQEVSKAFGAMATPHLFIFDKERILRYVGRIDDSKFGDPATIKTHDARIAIDELLAGNEVSTPKTRAHGCSTKWAYKRDIVVKYDEEFAAKEVTIESIDATGVEVLRENKTDKLRLVNLWATWCGPCLAEMSGLVEIGRQFETRGFDMITISTDSPDANEKATRLLKQFNAAIPKLTELSTKEEGRTTNNYLFDGDTDALAEALDPEWQGTMPHTVLIAPGGEIVHRISGEADITELKRVIVGKLGRWYSPE